MNPINILEVGLRDGIQNEKVHFSVSDRFFILKKLIQSGLRHIEIGSLVSPKAVPSMKWTVPLAKKINKELVLSKSLAKELKLFVLVPNEYGLNMALDLGLKHISVMASATESFSKKNTNCSIKENLKRIQTICQKARTHKIKIHGYLSMSFICPYEGPVPVQKVIHIARQMMDEGVTEIALSDTIGRASPIDIDQLITKIKPHIPVSQLRLHCHNTKGMALLNIQKGLEMGVTHFDSSIGGLGGCPYAPGSPGNVATEKLISLLHDMHYRPKINIEALIQIKNWIQNKKKIRLP